MKVRDAARDLDRLLNARESRDDWREVVAADPMFYARTEEAFRAGHSGLALVHGGEATRTVCAFHLSPGVTWTLARLDVRDALLVVHHPLRWDGAAGRFQAPDEATLDHLRDARISVYAAHDTLDRTGPLSTTGVFAGKVGIEDPCPLELPWMDDAATVEKPFPCGLIGRVPEVDLDALVRRLTAHYALPPIVRRRNDRTGPVACVPGRALLADAAEVARDAGAGTLVTGWVDDRTLLRRDLPVNIVCVSHYYSEVDTLAGLAAWLDGNGRETLFVDDPDARAAARVELARRPEGGGVW